MATRCFFHGKQKYFFKNSSSANQNARKNFAGSSHMKITSMTLINEAYSWTKWKSKQKFTPSRVNVVK